jgi:hypothetical protein
MLRKNRDGSADLAGRLTPAAVAVWDAILDSLAASQPAQDGTPDPRAPGQRRHDALLDAGIRLLQSGTLPDCGGTPVTVLAVVQADELRNQVSDSAGRDIKGRPAVHRRLGHDDVHGVEPGSGYATTSHGDLLSVAELLGLAAEADIVPVVLNSTGGVLSYGRTRRLASSGQRQALAARDHGCSFPGCTRPPDWCQAHHIVPWIDGGRTDIDEMTLLCGFHHREYEKRGSRCQIIGGTPHWIAPKWLDPDQVPVRNTAHHVDIRFELAS